jgi:DNA-binding FrmR family transcriptional regulator
MNGIEKKALKRRLARMSGQVRGLQSMVEAERDPVEILTQVAAVRAALDAVGVAIVRAQLADALDSLESVTPATQERVDRLRAALQRFIG